MKSGIQIIKIFSCLLLKVRRLFFIFSFWVVVLNCLPASAQVDSLLSVLNTTKADTTRADIMIELSATTLGTNPKRAEDYAKQALIISGEIRYRTGLANAYRYLGLAKYVQAEYGEAVDSWVKGVAMYDSIGDLANVARLYSNLGAVYESQSDDPTALEYNLKSQKIAEQIKDTVRLMSALTNIGAIHGKNARTYDKALEYDFMALDYAIKTGDTYVEGTLSANIGEIYFKQGKDTLALDYFLKALKAYDGDENTPYALLNIGKIYNRRGDFITAEDYQRQALEFAKKIDSKRDMSTALLALADTYYKKEDYKKALDFYKQAMNISFEINARVELRGSYQGLAQTFSALNDYKSAYIYQDLLTRLNDTIYNIEYDQKMAGQLFAFEIDKKQSQITILNKDKELQEVELKNQRIAKNASIAGLVFILIIAFIIFRNYRAKVKINKVLDRQKVEIESLLLNILPAEVASELQKSGHATPRSYENVSVLFTDFKGFTTIAKDMTPEELVAQLNEFFVAFDDIIEKNNLEKIKTIGDAYMCAGGIPTANQTHPVDIIKAGLEIQEFMEAHSKKRIAKGQVPWGLRVGIHTGPVTAGVVGRKKYAYDIWGSAVNIASRMESNGEVGKVNISNATYELVKDTFHCSHRGKISAKNVGEVDMYFVESPVEVPA